MTPYIGNIERKDFNKNWRNQGTSVKGLSLLMFGEKVREFYFKIEIDFGIPNVAICIIQVILNGRL